MLGKWWKKLFFNGIPVAYDFDPVAYDFDLWKYQVASGHISSVSNDENPNKNMRKIQMMKPFWQKTIHKDKVYHTVPSGNQTWLGKAPAKHCFFGGCSSYI